ncbi:hypothetical protein AGABI1DRAFT_114330 [Agaricus bisporus var. burnettii JB137-S8]|uniref:Aldehyde dehydrogenase domain-containing protein n=1 Tax=Agaricus bisporus var. burnettii (strain JB137-S8 / ATCC MYA-4627 / FGSC 10392) TaxID=597362 RepID=K5WTI6_AGABU|nr:uncharacterized protein AGABI1DRAFT_114330 [Agaricus bisporus var. burnettii JB137-S8]EKM78726.1 hypothetical protein AGABI1DRAFT_114330 [Agaricus bisporus var. burnettii JB137-S8]
MSQVPFTPLIIDGKERPGSSSESFEICTPHTGTLVGTAASATSQDCRDAIEAAAKAYKTWEKTRIVERRQIYKKAIELFETEHWKNILTQTSREEIAFTKSWSEFDVFLAKGYVQTGIAVEEKLRGEFYPAAHVPGAMVYVQPRAKGVLFAIAPWNAPAALTVRSISIAIFCGNTIVMKGSELTARTHYLVTKLFHEAGLPNGVLNCISTSPEATPTLVKEIIAHPLIRNVNFTGSDRVGKIIAVEAAKHLKPCVFELGGKAPCIVTEDANLKEAARGIVFGGLANSGQVCMSTERVIVHKDIADSLITAIREMASSIKAGGTPGDPNIQIGPLFSEKSAERFINILTEAKAAGAQALLGDLTRDKAVVQPHLFTGVKPGMKLWDEESFGPVILFSTYENIDDAIDLANATTYSLTSSVWSKDVAKARDIAFQLRYGTVNINGLTLHPEPVDELVGLSGSSGYGRFDFHHFTDKRTTIVHPEDRQYVF